VREVPILSVHLLVTVAKLLRPGGARAVAAESLLLKHQLLIRNRSRKRAPNLTTLDGTVNLPLGTGQRARQLNNPGLEHPMHTPLKEVATKQTQGTTKISIGGVDNQAHIEGSSLGRGVNIH
jgi:hypothetical protein